MRKSQKSVVAVVGLLAATVLFNQECQSQAPSAAPAAAPAAGGTSGIKGKAAFTGPAPVMPKLKREADPFCGKTPMNDQEVIVNSNGTLKNVVIRVVKGAAPVAVPATPVIIDQANCMYVPRIVAGMTGQKILIKNSDPLMHNVHAYAGTATTFNRAQMKGSKDIEQTIAAGVTKFKCDVHPWMTGYSVGNDNPYICVTGDTGECSINGVPNGTYTVEAWHEKYGTKTVDVTVNNGVINADFSFAAQ